MCVVWQEGQARIKEEEQKAKSKNKKEKKRGAGGGRREAEGMGEPFFAHPFSYFASQFWEAMT